MAKESILTLLTLLTLLINFNPIKEVIFAPANLNLNYFWTTCGINLKLYDFS